MGKKKRPAGLPGMPRRIWASAELNNYTFNDFYFRLKAIALSRFEWLNMPDTVDIRFLERALFERGQLTFFKDETLGYLALNSNLGGQLNVYDIPLVRQVYTSNGTYTAQLNPINSVIIWNNYLHTPTEMSTRLYASRLYEIQRAIDVNIKGQKTPKVILTPQSQRLTMQNLFMQYDGNEPFIYGDPDMLTESKINVLDTTAPYVADKLNVLKHDLMNEYLTFLGIENSNQDKKERLVADEVASNYGAVEAQRNAFLDSRKEACKQINSIFGLNVDVRFKSDVQTTVNAPNMEGGENDGEVYNPTEDNN